MCVCVHHVRDAFVTSKIFAIVIASVGSVDGIFSNKFQDGVNDTVDTFY